MTPNTRATPNPPLLNGLIILSHNSLDHIYGPDERAQIARRVNLISPPIDSEELTANPSLLNQVQVVFSGWNSPPMTRAFLDHAPHLQAVFYGGGSIRHLVDDEFWSRGVKISSSYGMNGLTVADYTLGAILTGLKHGFYYARYAHKHGRRAPRRPMPGTFETMIGIISLGAAGRALLGRLRAFDFKVIAHDPYISRQMAGELKVELVSLDEIFQRADAVSLHTPELPETIGLIKGTHFARMKPGALFINTARGAIVREAEMIEVLARRPDLTAVLDVTEPEPPPPNSPLYSMDNVVLTPHIAGAIGLERRRIGRAMIEEFDRWQRGEPLQWEITRESIVHMA